VKKIMIGGSLKAAVERFQKVKAGYPGRAFVSFMPGNLVFKSEGTPPNYANARMHWRVKFVSLALWKAHVVKHIGRTPAQWRIEQPQLTLTLFSLKEPDFDNLVSRWKPVIDGLVAAGIIQDDKISVIGSPTFHWRKVKKLKDQSIEILVSDIKT